MYKRALTLGALFAMIAVILGAFAAHGLKAYLPAEQIEIFDKGVTYEFYHSFALFVVGIIYSNFPGKILKIATVLFALGIVFFSGSLFLTPFLDTKNISVPVAVRLITPLGGLCFIGGWAFLLSGIIKKTS